MFYVRNPTLGSISAMYGSQARQAIGDTLQTSFNLYLGMENSIRVLNNAIAPVAFDLDVLRPGGSSTSSFVVPGRGAKELLTRGNFGTVADTYGVLRLRAGTGGSLVMEVLREHSDPSDLSTVDFLAPLPAQ